jgi:signal transduction histidine kinase
MWDGRGHGAGGRSVAVVVRALVDRPRRIGGPWLRVLDVAAGAALAALFVGISAHVPPAGDQRHVDALGYALVAGAGASVALWRRWPQVVVGVSTVVLAFVIGRHYPNGPVWITGWVALLALSWRTSRRIALIGAGLMFAVLSIVALAVDGLDAVTLLPLIFLGWSAAAVLLGDTLRNRRDYLTGLEERARYLEHTREEQARRRVAEDRLRIARDLHDSVAHAMATINVQAGAAAHVVQRRPEAARDALAAIQRASGEVLDELNGMLGLLRDPAESAQRAPTPGIAEIEHLVDATRDAGVSVSLVVDGPTVLVPTAVGTAAYRIVQESLTNVIKHAGASAAQVHVHAGTDRGLAVEVCDDGAGGRNRSAGAGVGIRGMRERAASTGGVLAAGPGPRAGFVVRAEWDGRS